MVRFRSTAARAALVAVATTATVIGVPAVANAAPAATATTVVQQDACSTIRSVAAPILQLLNLGLINVATAVQLIANLTGLPVAQIVACLGL